MKKLLIIDDEELIVQSIKEILEGFDIAVTGFSDPEQGLERATNENFDLYLFDLRMPKLNGAEITKRLLEEKPNSKVMIITAFPQDELAIKALEYGAFALLKKPFEITKILHYFNYSGAGNGS